MLSFCVWFLAVVAFSEVATSPLPWDVPSPVDKRTLEDPPIVQLPPSPYFPPFSVYPGVKPLKPLWPPGFFLNRFAAPPTPPPVDPVAVFFKNKKEEFLNKLFDDLTLTTDSPDLQVRAAAADPGDGTAPAPIIDPSVFITKKFDFLTELFKALNTTTPSPLPGEVVDPAATTVKPTIVPPGFWAPFPKPPKPPKATKPSKPSKPDTLLLDDALLKSILDQIDPASLQARSVVTDPTSAEEVPTTTPKPKIDPSVFKTKKIDFLTELFKALNTTTPVPLPGEVVDPTATTVKPTIVPPGFWVPVPKPPKPPKATKPPKPSKASTLLLSAIDEALLKSVLGDIDPSSLQARSVVPETDPTSAEEVPTTTPKPKIDPSVFITKKFDFLTQLFKSLNTTTPAPLPGEVVDPAATTVKPTIVPPGFWVPFPKPPKPPKATKPPKPEKTKTLLLNAIDEALLKSVLAQIDPANPALAETTKVARASFLDEFLHRVTEPPPTEEPASESTLSARSLVPPGYWIPPYIYAAKMGIYLDKLFDTIDSAATEDEGLSKRAVAADANPSALILDQMTALKNAMIAAYAEGKKAAAAAVPTKPPVKGFKKPLWGPKTTPAPDTVQQHLNLLSDVYDKLAAVEQQLLLSPTTPPTATPTVSYWAPDPAAVDIGEFYKEKTQNFLAELFANNTATSTVAP